MNAQPIMVPSFHAISACNGPMPGMVSHMRVPDFMPVHASAAKPESERLLTITLNPLNPDGRIDDGIRSLLRGAHLSSNAAKSYLKIGTNTNFESGFDNVWVSKWVIKISPTVENPV